MDAHFSAAVLCNARWWEGFNTKLTHLERDFQRLFCPHQKNNSISNLVTRQEGWYWVILKGPSFCSLTMLFDVGDNIIVIAAIIWSKPRCALNKFLIHLKGQVFTLLLDGQSRRHGIRTAVINEEQGNVYSISHTGITTNTFGRSLVKPKTVWIPPCESGLSVWHSHPYFSTHYKKETLLPAWALDAATGHRLWNVEWSNTNTVSRVAGDGQML